MKTSEILDKVTLEFAGGGKLALSDYAPYISNADAEVEGISEEKEVSPLINLFSTYISKINFEPDLYIDDTIENPTDSDYLTIDDMMELVNNNFENYSGSGRFNCLYEKEKCQNFLHEDREFYDENNQDISIILTFDLVSFCFKIVHDHLGYDEYTINGKEYVSIFEWSL